MKKLTIFFMLAVVCFQNGCGMVGIMSSPTRHEKKIPAEYDLTKHKNRKLLVLVNQGSWVGAQVNLRLHLTEAISKELVKKIKLKSEYLVSYNELSEFRSGRADFSLLSPAQVSQALGTDMVLLVMVEDYNLYEMAETGYLKGFLSARTALFEMATAVRLWPKSEKAKSIKVGFELEGRGREIAVERLSAGLAHCIVRCLYNCPVNEFNISDNKAGPGWGDWK